MPEHRSIELDEDISHERRQWRAERIGWAIMLLLALAALLGLLGHGPLSRTNATSSDGRLRVEYYRFEREAAPSDLKVTFAAADQGDVGIWIDRAFADSLDIEAITPEPDRVEPRPDRVIFYFHFAQPGESSVRIRFEARSPGFSQATLGIDGHAAQVQFGQIIYP